MRKEGEREECMPDITLPQTPEGSGEAKRCYDKGEDERDGVHGDSTAGD